MKDIKNLVSSIKNGFNEVVNDVETSANEIIKDSLEAFEELKKKALELQCPYFEANCKLENCPCTKYKACMDAQDPTIVADVLEELGVDVNSDPWELLMTMQAKFAAKFHKVDNLTKPEMDHWINAYLVCIEDEVREVREHLRIYPEDKFCGKTMNEKELKKELIDILHFMMDAFICGGATSKDIEKYYLEKNAPNVKEVYDLLKFAYDNEKSHLQFDSNDIDILLIANKILDCNAAVRQQISWKHWKKPSETINKEALYKAYAEMFKNLMILFIILEMTPENVKEVYVNKNMENILRQKYGY